EHRRDRQHDRPGDFLPRLRVGDPAGAWGKLAGGAVRARGRVVAGSLRDRTPRDALTLTARLVLDTKSDSSEDRDGACGRSPGEDRRVGQAGLRGAARIHAGYATILIGARGR